MTPYDIQRANSWRAQASRRPNLTACFLCFTLPMALGFGLSLANPVPQCKPQSIVRLL